MWRAVLFILMLVAAPVQAQTSGCNPSGINGCPREMRVPIPEPRPIVVDVVMTRDRPNKEKRR